jgi:hypothetical protein
MLAYRSGLIQVGLIGAAAHQSGVGVFVTARDHSASLNLPWVPIKAFSESKRLLRSSKMLERSRTHSILDE